LKFRGGISILRLVDPSPVENEFPLDAPLGCVEFDIVQTLSSKITFINHLHTDMHDDFIFCIFVPNECPSLYHTNPCAHLTIPAYLTTVMFDTLSV